MPNRTRPRTFDFCDYRAGEGGSGAEGVVILRFGFVVYTRGGRYILDVGSRVSVEVILGLPTLRLFPGLGF